MWPQPPATQDVSSDAVVCCIAHQKLRSVRNMQQLPQGWVCLPHSTCKQKQFPPNSMTPQQQQQQQQQQLQAPVYLQQQQGFAMPPPPLVGATSGPPPGFSPASGPFPSWYLHGQQGGAPQLLPAQPSAQILNSQYFVPQPNFLVSPVFPSQGMVPHHQLYAPPQQQAQQPPSGPLQFGVPFTPPVQPLPQQQQQ